MKRKRWGVAVIIAILTLTVSTSAAFAQVKLLLTTMSPPGSDNTVQFFAPWADRINAAARGSIVVEVRDGFALANYGNIYDRVTSDVVQIGWGMQGLIAGKFPFDEVAGLPFEADSAEQASVAYWRLYERGALGDAYKDIKPLVLGTYPMNGVHYAKRPKSLDDLTGLKVRAASKLQSDLIERLGGAPISLGAEDVYQALARGMIDAVIVAFPTFGPFKLQEVTNFHVDVALGTSTIMFFMSKRKFDSLPEAGKEALNQNSGEATSRSWGSFYDREAKKERDRVLALPNQVEVRLDPDQERRWREKAAQVTAAWVAAYTGRDKVLAEYRQILAAVKAGK